MIDANLIKTKSRQIRELKNVKINKINIIL